MSNQNLLCSSLSPDRIELGLEISSRKKLLETMAGLLARGAVDAVKEKDIYHLLWEREKLGNTGFGGGIALPHARCAQVDKAVIAVISLDSGVDYDAMDGQDVDLAFGLLVPKDATQEHLDLLAQIAKLLNDQGRVQMLKQSSSTRELIELVNKWCKAQT